MKKSIISQFELILVFNAQFFFNLKFLKMNINYKVIENKYSIKEML